MTPAPELGAALGAISPDDLCGHDAVSFLHAEYRQLAHQQGRMLVAVSHVARCGFDEGRHAQRMSDPDRWSTFEVKAALGLTRAAAADLIEQSWDVVDRAPEVAAAMLAGELDLLHRHTGRSRGVSAGHPNPRRVLLHRRHPELVDERHHRVDRIQRGACPDDTLSPAARDARGSSSSMSAHAESSRRAVANLERICREELAGEYTLEVVDVAENPEHAEADRILATPALIRQLPPPLRRLIGDLGQKEHVLAGLEVKLLK